MCKLNSITCALVDVQVPGAKRQKNPNGSPAMILL